MKKEFITYSSGQLLEEKTFIAWVLHGTNSREWEVFLETHPECRPAVIQAREVLLLLRDSHSSLHEDSVLGMWRNIDQLAKLQHEKEKKVRLKSFISKAASVLIIVALGIGGYLFLRNTEDDKFGFSELAEQTDEARITLPNGENIVLDRDNSSISVDSKNDLVAVNDTIILLEEQKQSNQKELPLNEVIIPYGKKSELLLADGTKVWLNAGSRLAFPSKFTGNTRTVYLEGEACFKVTENENQPFIVKAGELDVKVLGTLFDLSAYPVDETIETVLLEGSVAIHKPGRFGIGKKEISLQPNQKASFSKEDKKIAVSNESNAGYYISWTNGWMEFSQENLRSVFIKLERYYNVDIQMPANFPSDELISGKLDLKNSISEVMVVLSDVANINFRISEDQLFIEKRMNELRRGQNKK